MYRIESPKQENQNTGLSLEVLDLLEGFDEINPLDMVLELAAAMQARHEITLLKAAALQGMLANPDCGNDMRAIVRDVNKIVTLLVEGE